MTRALAAAVLTLAAGCSSSRTRGEVLIDEMCACKDKPCAERVSRELTTLTDAMRAGAAPGSTPPELARLQRQEHRYFDCLGRALGEKIDGTIQIVLPADAATLDAP